MPKGSPERTQARRDEIVNACAKLYETMSFKEITIKEIAAFTSFTRPSIYNYFQTKEEIFLAFLQQEYERWTEELNDLRPAGGANSRLEAADQIARTLAYRERLLKLLSTNLNEMEQNSRLENLVEFKRAYGASIQAVRDCLGRFCPDMEEAEREDFVASFFPLVYGIYPYTAVSEEQRIAMERAGISYRRMTIYELAFLGAKKLLGVKGWLSMSEKILVAYFSASGETARLAKTIADVTGGELFEIQPKVPYTSADLNWNDDSSRSSVEMRDPGSRPEISGSVAGIASYKYVFVGFPIWWYEAPRIIETFLESYDFSGKTVIPFATSGGSGFGKTDGILQKSCSPETDWRPGRRMSSSASAKEVQKWIDSLKL